MRVFLFCLLLCTAGCRALTIPDKAFDQANNNAQLCDIFLERMDAGLTTREQEQAFIKSNRRAWHSKNFALNDTPLPPDVEAWEAVKRLGLL